MARECRRYWPLPKTHWENPTAGIEVMERLQTGADRLESFVWKFKDLVRGTQPRTEIQLHTPDVGSSRIKARC